jgi:hypothetical protein
MAKLGELFRKRNDYLAPLPRRLKAVRNTPMFGGLPRPDIHALS